MKAVMVMYDSLRLDMLPSYGGRQVKLPNFERLESHTVTFDDNYVCSLPCMPARRELHTGRPNFLHRSWGPMEPFDDSMPELLKNNGIYTRLVTDHNHYVEDGGCTYHPRYSTWECNRGQEGDPWVGSARPDVPENPHTMVSQEGMPPVVKHIMGRLYRQDVLNRERMTKMADFPQARTFAQGLDFLENNHEYDNWFLQIETFDPHEPFCVPDEFLSRLFDPDDETELDWPPYAPVSEPPEVVEQVRRKYLALLAFCDDNLGRVLDVFDKYDMWRDTMLIVNTDHGYLLGEHGWWSKSQMPDYQEIAHIPLYIWDPRYGVKGERRSSLVQTIDLAPTILDYFGLPIPADMLGKPLGEVIREDEPVREYGIFGSHGGVLSVTDGKYVYMTAPVNTREQLYDYTLMPTHMRARFSVEEMRKATLDQGFSFTKGCPVLKIPAQLKHMSWDLPEGETRLFDVQEDPEQKCPLRDPQTEGRMRQGLIATLKANDAPEEIYRIYGLDQ